MHGYAEQFEFAFELRCTCVYHPCQLSAKPFLSWCHAERHNAQRQIRTWSTNAIAHGCAATSSCSAPLIAMLSTLQRQARHPLLQHSAPALRRFFASETESAIQQKLQSALSVQEVNVRDTSGGCGTMFEIKLVAEDFKSKSIVQQHKMVTKILKEDIAQWHGFTMLTSAPSQS